MEFSKTPFSQLAGATPAGNSGPGLIALVAFVGLACLVFWWRSPDDVTSETLPKAQKKKKRNQAKSIPTNKPANK